MNFPEVQFSFGTKYTIAYKIYVFNFLPYTRQVS